jgi:hypothetical protein
VTTGVIPVIVVVDEIIAVAVVVVVNIVAAEVAAVINEEVAEASKAKAVVIDVMTGTIVVPSVRK